MVTGNTPVWVKLNAWLRAVPSAAASGTSLRTMIWPRWVFVNVQVTVSPGLRVTVAVPVASDVVAVEPLSGSRRTLEATQVRPVRSHPAGTNSATLYGPATSCPLDTCSPFPIARLSTDHDGLKSNFSVAGVLSGSVDLTTMISPNASSLKVQVMF